MRISSILSILVAALLAGCLSRSEPVPMHLFEPELPPLEAESVPGTRPLRFDSVSAPAHLRGPMIWRVSGTEIAQDDVNLWVEEPAKVLDRRLRDLLFGAGGFRESLRSTDPELKVHLAVFEGDLGDDARIELLLELTAPGPVGLRHRLVEVESMPTRDPEGLAQAMGPALARAAAACAAWVETNLDR